MAEHSEIEWTNATWNPIVGCSVHSPGCTNCYAMKLAARLERMGSPIYRGLTTQTNAGAVWNGKVEPSSWAQQTAPLRWPKPKLIFVNSMSDLFHESVSWPVIDQVYAVMALARQHTYQVLTKRSERMGMYLCDPSTPDRINAKINEIAPAQWCDWEPEKWPLPHVWQGVSVEDQKRADERLPDLRATPAAVRFVSFEPLLEPVVADLSRIHWAICGGESGPGARDMNHDWARALRDDCAAQGVAFFFKQMARRKPIPSDLMVRQMPNQALRDRP